MIRFGTAFLAALVFAQLCAYFAGPIAPDEASIVEPAPLGRFDPQLAPAVMAEDCRREGKQLFAERTFGEWQYGCVAADGWKR